MNVLYIVLGIAGGVVLLMVAMRLFIQIKTSALKGKPVPTLSEKFENAIHKEKTVLFYFYSPSCGACASMTPVVKTLSNTNKNIFAVDVSTDMDTARKLSVMATPTLIVIKKRVITDVFIGPQSPASIQELLA